MLQSPSRSRLLENARAYERCQSLLARKNARRIIADKYIETQPGDRILDVGCGPGTMFPYVGSEVEYTGFDINADYIAHARRRFGNRAAFFEGTFAVAERRLTQEFDIVIAVAILHHLADQEARALFQLADRVLRPGGRLVTSDCVLIARQNAIARLLIRLDRGKHVRTKEGYLALARERFSDVTADVRRDLLRVPYTHCVMVCCK